MLNKVKRVIGSLRRNASGNVLLIFALGMPVFVGGAGLAVDTAQWYMWKREMQYAVDQAALAGAWSRVGGSTGNVYQTRAQQELTANLQVVDFQGTPSISLANYNGGTANSVLVTLSASQTLPFSSMLMNKGVTINVSAQAKFEQKQTFNACMIALDPTGVGAITVGGGAYVAANCGALTLSKNRRAIIKNGSPTFDVGYVVAAGGIDNAFDGNPNLQVFEDQPGLTDPFASLTPPNDTRPRTYLCSTTTTYTAQYSDTTLVEDWTYTSATASGPWSGPTKASVSSAAGQSGTEPATSTTRVNDNNNPATPYVTNTSAGTVQTVPGQTTTTCNNAGNNCRTTTTPSTYKRVDRVTSTVHSIVSITSQTSPPMAAMKPGTYSDFTASCPTTMDPGVYVIDGGQFRIGAQYPVAGPGVMIVLKNGAGLDVNGGADFNLRAMTPTEMTTAGISSADAVKLKGMLIFEDRNSPGSNNYNTLNGNAGAFLDGSIYLPKSDLHFAGKFGVVFQCLVMAAKTITIEGTTNMTSLCPPGPGYKGAQINSGGNVVKLVG